MRAGQIGEGAMGYVFSGVFGRGMGAAADVAARFGGVWRAWPEAGEGGVAVAFAADHDGVGDRAHEVETSELPAWSAAWPGGAWAYLQVECFGGACDQRGFAFSEGRILEACGWATSEGPRLRVFRAAGLPASANPFAPLTRNWFPPRPPPG